MEPLFEVGDSTELMEPLLEDGDELMEPLLEPMEPPLELMEPLGEVTELIEPSMDLLVGVGAITATGDGAGSTVPGPVGGTTGVVTGVVAGAGTIPEQQSNTMPSVVGQHSPTNPSDAQTG